MKKYYPALMIAVPLIAIATFSSAHGEFFSSIASAGYGGQGKFCPTTATMTLTPSGITVTPGQHVDFNGRNFAIEEDIIVYLDGVQFAKAHADGGGNFTTGSLTMPSAPGTYTFSFVGVNCTTPMIATITVAGTGTTPPGNGGTGTSTPPTPTPGFSGTITPSSRTVSAGTHIDFAGRGFGHEEDVIIRRDGTQIGTAHADGGGNFTTGSIVTPSTPGTYTYTFTGIVSNTPVSSVITIQ